MGNKKLAFVNSSMLIWARSETPFAISPDLLSMRFPRITTEKLKNGSQEKNFLQYGKQKI